MDSRFTDAERLNTMLPRRVERLQKTRACPVRPKAHDFSKNLATNTLVMSENRAVTKVYQKQAFVTTLNKPDQTVIVGNAMRRGYNKPLS